MKSAVKEEGGFCEIIIYLSIRKASEDISAKIWGVKEAAKQRPEGISLPGTESSSTNKPQKAGEDCSCPGG